MLIHLVRKDFLIVKKYVLLMLAVCVIIPPCVNVMTQIFKIFSTRF